MTKITNLPTFDMVEHLTTDLGVSKIALLMQDDSFGESVKSGISGALSKRNRLRYWIGDSNVQRLKCS